MAIFDKIKNLFTKKAKNEPECAHTRVNLGDDPTDPHGDGTLREGDFLYDLLMKGSGMIHATRVGDTDEWDVTEIKE